jgi:hypothetical protein
MKKGSALPRLVAFAHVMRATGLTQPGSNCFVTTRLGLSRSMDTPIVPNSTEPVWNEECCSPRLLACMAMTLRRYNLKCVPGFEAHRYLSVDVMHKVSCPSTAQPLNFQNIC